MIAVKCVKRTSGNIKVYGHITDYTYYDRRLSVSDFEQFDHNSTYRDIVDRIGLENGTIGSGILRSYYELEDGRFVICGVWGNGLYFSVVNHEDHEYYLLPPILKQKSDIIKISGKWVKLEKIILSEVTQTQKDKYGMYSVIIEY